ncbi:MAG: AAA family ATPase [Fibrobacter sp.]|nr:AAA family ATPase [Fibrobacter sp.]
MPNTVIISQKSLAPLIFEAFSYLQEKKLVVSLFRYATETIPNSGKEDERLIKLDDGNGHKLTGLFLKASKESMLERNARRAPRWFEAPFVINGQEYYLSSQWNASGNFQLTLPVLNYFLKECCGNEAEGTTFSIYKSGDEFIFAQVDYKKRDDNMRERRERIESEFRSYLSNVAKNEHNSTLSSSSIATFLRVIKSEILFDYNPTKWAHVESVYDITNAEEIEKIIEDLESDPLFKEKDKNDSSYKYHRSVAIKKYRDFLDYRNHDNGINTVRQCIFFGAPGTGKSYKVNSILPNESVWNLTGEERKNLFMRSEGRKNKHNTDVLNDESRFSDNVWEIDELSLLEKKLSEVDSEDNVSNPEHTALQAYIKVLKEYKFEQKVFRTTFHPDYDYAQFVGAYKPKKEEEKITYSFVPQVFAKAYAAAWKLQLTGAAKSNVFLVIEEINRGNCAQIFGDIFQLLDRNGSGASQYSIDADNDFATWLKEESVLKDDWPNYVDKVGEGKLKLPPNLNILATMNTSDQSLFPMDSAFKRRFDWEYVPISFDGKDAANFQIDIDGSQYPWQKFVETVNEKILSLTESEDKQLGEFFIKPDNGNVISKDRFLGKVMFYLWNEVCKDEHKNGSFFRTKDDGHFTFQDLYKPEKKDLLKKFLDELLKDGASQD